MVFLARNEGRQIDSALDSRANQFSSDIRGHGYPLIAQGYTSYRRWSVERAGQSDLGDRHCLVDHSGQAPIDSLAFVHGCAMDCHLPSIRGDALVLSKTKPAGRCARHRASLSWVVFSIFATTIDLTFCMLREDGFAHVEWCDLLASLHHNQIA
jgi:hypothetical protein